jgi:polyhydroxybutyrate depolymerase
MRRGAAMIVTLALLGACSSSHQTAHGPSASTVPRSDTTISTTVGTTAVTHRSAGCAARRPVASGISQHTIRSGGRTRVYELDVPAGYAGNVPYALVFGLHALTVDYRFVPSMTGFADGARYRFIGVSPSGLVAKGTPYWDAAPTPDNYDVTFIAHLLDALESELCIDPARVFSTGMSNGAQMSSLLACRLSTRITAIAPVSGEEFLAPCAGGPVPIMAFHGTADPILPYAGGGLNATRIAELYYYRGHLPAGLPTPLGIDASMALWARHNKCSPQPVERRITPHVSVRTWQHCAAATVLYIIHGGGHQWPGQPQPAFDKEFGPGTKEINATDLMFHFFFDPPR